MHLIDQTWDISRRDCVVAYIGGNDLRSQFYEVSIGCVVAHGHALLLRCCRNGERGTQYPMGPMILYLKILSDFKSRKTKIVVCRDKYWSIATKDKKS